VDHGPGEGSAGGAGLLEDAIGSETESLALGFGLDEEDGTRVIRTRALVGNPALHVYFSLGAAIRCRRLARYWSRHDSANSRGAWVERALSCG
jgi:hypothetical protein